MKRFKMNKRKSRKNFRKTAGKTQSLNLIPATGGRRGGWRL